MNKTDTIKTLQMEVEIPDVVLKKANQAFDDIRQNNTKVNTRRKISKKKIALIIVAAVLILATLGVVAAYLDWSKSLSEGLQVTEEQKTQLEENNMATYVNQSCTDQGITVTAVQNITDNYYTYIALKVEGYEPEDEIQPDFETVKVTVDGKEDFKLAAGFYDSLIRVNEGTTYADGSPIDPNEYSQRYVMEDGSLEFRITLISREKGYFINKPIHLELNNLGTISKNEYFNKINGTWSFDWDLQGSEDVKEVTLNVPLDDTNATVLKAELTPISLRAEYEFPRQDKTVIALLDENGEEVSFILEDRPPALTGVKMKDGTLHYLLDMFPNGSGYESENSDLYITSFGTDRIIDVNQVDSILFIKSYPEEDPFTEDNFYVVPIE